MSSNSYTREMAVTHNDFYRILPRAMGTNAYQVANNTVIADVSGGEVTISLGEEKVRKIALLEIPYCEVAFAYRGMTENQYESFRERFELYFRRGGG